MLPVSFLPTPPGLHSVCNPRAVKLGIGFTLLLVAGAVEFSTMERAHPYDYCGSEAKTPLNEGQKEGVYKMENKTKTGSWHSWVLTAVARKQK